MSAKTSDMPKVPYGVTADGTIRFTSDVPASEYGLRCALYCPECGGRLEAVRRSAADASTDIAFFRHTKTVTNGNPSCCGYGETSSHRAAKEVLRRSVGKAFWLPSIFLSDYAPHVGTFADASGERVTHIPYVPSTSGTLPHQVPSDIVARNPTPVLIEIVHIETAKLPGIPEGMRPDAVICVLPTDGTGKARENATSIPIAIEVRNTHAKDIEDVRKYAEASTRVIEISVGDISPEDSSFESTLTRRMLGTGTGDADMLREWLSNPSAMAAIDAANGRRWELSYGIQLRVRGAHDSEPICHRLCGYLPDRWGKGSKYGRKSGRGRFDTIDAMEMARYEIRLKQDGIDDGHRFVSFVMSVKQVSGKAIPFSDILDMLRGGRWEETTRAALDRLSEDIGIDVLDSHEDSDDVSRALVDYQWRKRGGGKFVPTVMPGSDFIVGEMFRERKCAWSSRRGDWYTVCRSCWRCPQSEGHWKVPVFSVHVNIDGEFEIPNVRQGYDDVSGEPIDDPVTLDSNDDVAIVTVDAVKCHARKAIGAPGFFDSLDGMRKTLSKASKLRNEVERFLEGQSYMTDVSGDRKRTVNAIEDLGHVR